MSRQLSQPSMVSAFGIKFACLVARRMPHWLPACRCVPPSGGFWTLAG